MDLGVEFAGIELKNPLTVACLALVLEEAGADAIGGNYLSLPRIDIYDNGKPLYPSLKRTSFGTLAGPCFRHAAYRTVAKLYRDLKIPILGGGGITKWRDIVEIMMWGATAISICTSIMWVSRFVPKMQ